MRTLSILITLLLINAAGCEETALLPSSSESSKLTATSTALKLKAQNVVRQQLDDASAYLRCHAIEVVVETGQRNYLPQIIQRLKDSSVAVRFAAATAIGDLKCVPCEKDLAPLLSDVNENVRISAAYAMMQVGNPSSKEVLYNAVNSKDDTVRANAVLLIGKLRNRADLELLYSVLRDNRSTEKVRFQTVESIARLGDISIYRDKLWPMLISKYADDRVMGIRGMGALANYDAQVAIQTMLQDDVTEVRLAAAEQLGRMNDFSGREEVVKYFRANPNLVEPNMANHMAVLAIGRVGGHGLDSYLEAALNSPSKLIQLAGAQSTLLLNK